MNKMKRKRGGNGEEGRGGEERAEIGGKEV